MTQAAAVGEQAERLGVAACAYAGDGKHGLPQCRLPGRAERAGRRRDARRGRPRANGRPHQPAGAGSAPRPRHALSRARRRGALGADADEIAIAADNTTHGMNMVTAGLARRATAWSRAASSTPRNWCRPTFARAERRRPAFRPASSPATPPVDARGVRPHHRCAHASRPDSSGVSYSTGQRLPPAAEIAALAHSANAALVVLILRRADRWPRTAPNLHAEPGHIRRVCHPDAQVVLRPGRPRALYIRRDRIGEISPPRSAGTRWPRSTFKAASRRTATRSRSSS